MARLAERKADHLQHAARPDVVHARPAGLAADQIRRPDGPRRAAALVELLGADGLSVHLNPIQEAVQPEGEPRFAGVAEAIAGAAALGPEHLADGGGA